MLPVILLYIVIFLYGIVIGSFLNVVIYRVPKKENMVTTRSHCMSCGYQLTWYDLIPLFSWLALGGKCRKCKAKISVQYPLIEGLNGVLYLVIFARYGLSIDSLLYCLLFSALIALSVIDFRTYEIANGFSYFICGL
ncbi:MAG: prepilin peptidase, partial [Lachnospiraceae bacterium]|nr:prepilin peptidase [Lachnospiraceae bacterium]